MSDHNENQCDFCRAAYSNALTIRKRIHAEGQKLDGTAIRDAWIDLMNTICKKHGIDPTNISETTALAITARTAGKAMYVIVNHGINEARRDAAKAGKPLDEKTVLQMKLHAWESVRMAICSVADFADVGIEFGFNPAPCQAFPTMTTYEGTKVQ